MSEEHQQGEQHDDDHGSREAPPSIGAGGVEASGDALAETGFDASADRAEDATESISGPEGVLLETMFDPASSDSVLEHVGRILGEQPRVSLGGHAEEDVGSAELSEQRVLEFSRPFEVTGELGRGGMGIVLRARDTDLGRDVAIKVLRESYARRPDVLRRFVEEAQIGGQLQHPGIVQVYEIGLQGGQEPYFVMRLFKGQTLAELLRGRSDLRADLAEHLGIFLQVCQAMGYAHERGVIHRDLKPSNIMVGAFGAVQVADWGLAKVLGSPEPASDHDPAEPERRKTRIFTRGTRGDSASDMSSAGTVMGTIAFMPPEQARGEIENLDQRADVFALGAILALILTGKPANVGSRDDALRRASEGDQSELLERLARSDADPALLSLTAECLSPDRVERPADAGVLAQRIQSYLTSVEARAEAARIAAAEERVKAAGERRARWLTLALASTLILAVVGGSVAYSTAASRKAAREKFATEAVRDALSDAERMRSVAESSASLELAPWDIALQAAQRARDLAAADVAPPLRARADRLHAELATERDATVERAAQEERNRNLHLSLTDIREASLEEGKSASRTLKAYERAVSEFGIDVRKTPPAELVEIIHQSGMEREVVSILDQLAFTAREGIGKFNPATPLMLAIASQVDSDPWRSRLRAAVTADDADEILRLADSVDPHSPPATLALLAMTLNGMDFRDRALEVFELACMEHPADFWLRVEATVLNLREARETGEKRWREASLVHANAAVALRPDLGATWALLARATTGEACLRALDRAGALRPGNNKLLLSMGKDLLRDGDHEKARVFFEKARDLQPSSPVPYQLLCEALLGLGEGQEAVNTFHQALELEPEDPELHTTLGTIYHQLERHDEALSALDRAVELSPRKAKPHWLKSLVFRDRGDLEREIDELELALELSPGKTRFLYSLAEAHRRSGNLERAIEVAQDLLVEDSGHIGAMISHANSLTLLRRFEEAIEVARGAVDAAQDQYTTHFTLGLILLQASRFRDAVASLEHSAELEAEQGKPSSLPIARVLDQARRGAAIADRVDAVLAGEADLEEGDDPLAFAEVSQMRGQADGALRFYREAFARDPTLAEDPFTHRRYNAACAAALVGGAPERQLAYDWLVANLDDLEVALDTGEREAALGILEHTAVDPDFGSVRDEPALAGLPTEEQSRWQALWQRLQGLIESGR